MMGMTQATYFNNRVATILAALASAALGFLIAAQPAYANTVAAINVHNVSQASPCTVNDTATIEGVWSNYNGSEPPRCTHNEATDEWTIYLADYYQIMDPVVYPYSNVYDSDGSILVRGMSAIWGCKVTTFAGNEITLTMTKKSNDVFEITDMSVLIDGEFVDVSHMWDGTHRESSTWFYFDDTGALQVL